MWGSKPFKSGVEPRRQTAACIHALFWQLLQPNWCQTYCFAFLWIHQRGREGDLDDWAPQDLHTLRPGLRPGEVTPVTDPASAYTHCLPRQDAKSEGQSSGIAEGLSVSENYGASTVIDISMISDEPSSTRRFILPSGVTVWVYRHDMLLSTANAIATSECTTLKAGGELAKQLLQRCPDEYRDARQRMKNETAHFEYGKVYPCIFATDSIAFNTVYHAMVPSAWFFFGILPSLSTLTGKWDKYARQAYKELFKKADRHKNTSLALPLFGSGKARANLHKAIDPLVSCLEHLSSYGINFPKSLKIIEIYTIKEEAYNLLTDRLQQCFGSDAPTGHPGRLPVSASSTDTETESKSDLSSYEFSASPIATETKYSAMDYEEAVKRNGMRWVYRMESSPRGIALIINNEKFDQSDKFTRRTGTQADCGKLCSLFKDRLHFQVKVLQDLTAQEMQNALRAFSQDQALFRVDSMMVAVLSHGGQGDIIYGIDGRLGVDGKPEPGTYIKATDIQSFFTSDNCPAMKDKPKLFIGQFCRGVMEHTLDQGVMHSGAVDRDGVEENRTHACADMYFLYATVPTYVAYRGQFVQVLCEIFQRYAHSHHIKDMATFVHDKMAQKELGNGHLTISEERGTLRKHWFFHPPPHTHVAFGSQTRMLPSAFFQMDGCKVNTSSPVV